MSDYGAQYTARVQRGLEIRLQRLFTEAQSDMLKKLDGFTAQFMEKDKKMLAKLEAGEITKEKYDRWVAGQVFQGAQWEQKLKDMTDSLSDYYGEALEKIHDKQIDVFSKNANYQGIHSDRWRVQIEDRRGQVGNNPHSNSPSCSTIRPKRYCTL